MDYYGLDLAHNGYGQYFFDSCVYAGSASRRSSIFHTCFEPTISFVMDYFAKQSETFIDIGANIGYHSLRISHFVNDVYAFEPSNSVNNLLKLNRKLYESTNIKISNLALSDTDNNDVKAEDSSIWTHKEDEIKSITFDKYYTENPIRGKSYLLKIDVDGFEGKVIQGMKNFIKNNVDHLDIIMEITPKNMAKFGSDLELFSSFMNTLGYDLYKIMDGDHDSKISDNIIDVYLNKNRIGYLEKIEINAPSIGKEANCVFTKKKLGEIQLESSFIEKKHEIIEKIDNKIDPKEILDSINTTRNDFFVDQWIRFIAITKKINLSQNALFSNEISNISCYQVREAWSYVYQNKLSEAKNNFEIILKKPDHFYRIKAIVGLYRIGEHETCIVELEKLIDDTVSLLKNQTIESRNNIGHFENYCDLLKAMHLIDIKRRKDFIRILLENTNKETQKLIHLQLINTNSLQNFEEVNANVWSSKELWIAYKAIVKNQKSKVLKELTSKFGFKTLIKLTLLDFKAYFFKSQDPLVSDLKPLAFQARNFDPLALHRKNPKAYLFKA